MIYQYIVRYERLISYATVAMLCAGAFYSRGFAKGEVFWHGLLVHGSESEHFESIAQMSTSADAVVVGRFVDFSLSRLIHGDAEEDVVRLGVARFEVRERVRGRAVPSIVPVEFLLTAGADRPVEEVVDRMARGVPKGEALLFLRKKSTDIDGGESGPFYRIVNTVGLWTESEEEGLQTPLRPTELTDSHASHASPGVRKKTDGPQRYAREVTGLKNLSELAQRLRAR